MPIKGNANIYSPFNYYLIREEETIPEVILTAAEVRYIIAEAYLRGLGVAMDVETAEEEYLQGLVASILFWQSMAENSSIWDNKPPNLF